ncbi:hypothetical protein [Aeromicrobium sp. REDSEA-S38_B2]|uniref:hypothetical protein n=1 Tax=Aeromicrobium sp. REDSEA-S38_B2 TaxID=1811528 RepID=UPI00257FCF04|nr:hypothetical protein [Aeromicrobium sp. REDSEA-S38_B2]
MDDFVTMMRLRVESDAALQGVRSLVPGGRHGDDIDGSVAGGVLLWLDAREFIDVLEYWWVTHEQPTELPDVGQVR